MHSLQLRLALALCASLAGLIIIQWWIVSKAATVISEDYIASRLEDDTESLLNVLGFDEKGLPFVDPAQVGPFFGRPYSGHYFRIIHGGDSLRSRSLWDHDLPDIQPPQLGSAKRQVADGPHGQKLLVMIGTYKKRGDLFTIEVGEDLTPIVNAIEHFETKFTMAAIVLLVILILIQVTIVRLSLKPLQRVRRDISKLERGEVAKLHESVPAELFPLVREVNDLLHIMSLRLVRSRNSLANLAHALKTPLAVLTQLADDEQLLRNPDLRQNLLEQTESMRGFMDRELKRARLSGAAAPGEVFEPQREVEFLVKIMRQVYAERHLSIEYSVPDGLAYAGDREDMLELIGNLLDNACKWAKKHLVIVFSAGAGLDFYIEDDGPGCSQNELEKLAQRGVRLDEQTPGHGLGLAIVKDIVELYQGTLDFTLSQKYGGLRVAISLPPRQMPGS